jgi:hypothetical protein
MDNVGIINGIAGAFGLPPSDVEWMAHRMALIVRVKLPKEMPASLVDIELDQVAALKVPNLMLSVAHGATLMALFETDNDGVEKKRQINKGGY